MREIINIQYLTLSILILALCACSPTAPPKTYDLSETETSLAEASYSVSRSIVDLAETAQAAHPLPKLAPPPSPATYGMSMPTSVDWSGPAEPILRQVAKTANYRLRTLGTAPAIPVIVTIYAKNKMLGDVLRDIGYQCGRRASVVVFPESRVIELRYAKN
ncbi:MAG TPA: type IVB secretion system lipoprotein DotD [Gammaproteobacteria bacterium]|nr:type IVB secretion system lipoprotein DotD [Gammaproteobacteria bacterium]